MERDLRSGLAGHLDQLCPEARSDIFASGRNTPHHRNIAKEGGMEGAWWNGETQGNYWTGYIMMAYLSGNAEAKSKADAFVQHILQYQDKNGYIGIYSPELQYSQEPENGELWTQTCILRGLLAYYELTGNTQVLNAVGRAVRCTMQHYGPGRMTAFGIPHAGQGIAHALMFVDVLEWLYDLTGEAAYRDFGVWLYEDFSLGIPSRWGDMTLANLRDLAKPWAGHGCDTYGDIRVPLWAYYVTGDPEFKQGFTNAFIKLRRYLLPGGAGVNMCWIQALQPDPTNTYYEFCSTRELLVSLCSALQKTGKADFGDLAERLMFNDAQGARGGKGKLITYCTRDNRCIVNGELQNHSTFSPTHMDTAVCCAPNSVQIMPLQLRAMWMRTSQGGLAATLYGPSTVDTQLQGVRVRIEETTRYPFSPVISLSISPEYPVEFPLELRNPGWSKATRVTCEGAGIARQGDYFILEKRWSPGDRVSVELDERITALRAVNGEVWLERGPLVYALRIPAVPRVIRTYNLHGFADFEYFPAPGAHWHYAFNSCLGKEGYGFAVREGKDDNPLFPFDGAPLLLEGKMIDLETGRFAEISFVPMASELAALREVTFQVAEARGGCEPTQ
jgi:hypothetical protein